MPKILLLGDSIRLNYQPTVERLLAGKASIVAPAENCQYALYTLSSLDRWISGLHITEGVDLVHWNVGLHDVGHNTGRKPYQFPISAYVANLRFILARLQKLTPKVIWATTTPIRGERIANDTGWHWEDWEIGTYNEEATMLMEDSLVQVHDLGQLVSKHIGEYLCADGIHLSDSGKKACGTAVANVCLKALNL